MQNGLAAALCGGAQKRTAKLDVLLTVHLIIILVIKQFNEQILVL